MTPCYVYVYYEPEGTIPRYVGMGSHDRHMKHWERARRDHGSSLKNSRFRTWLLGLHLRGLKPHIVKIEQNHTRESAVEREAVLIEQIGCLPLGPLMNKSPGREPLTLRPKKSLP